MSLRTSTVSIPRLIHGASLVDPSLHSPDLLHFLEAELSDWMIDHIADCVQATVEGAFDEPTSSRQQQIDFVTFTTNVLKRANVTTSVLLVALVYIDRAKPHLAISTREWAFHRVLLGALILASKYSNDSSLKNRHWAICTGVFGMRDVGRIEREFLDVLDWELHITEDNLIGQLHRIPFISSSDACSRLHSDTSA
ncbi:hypothetical protein V5O48_010355 [Marasmius crinis-equi]|uniref:Cyclin-like domain-containing protein n=1 Tax=Marasmius crinis-equi TaxID=585013 RepID=A0ABR3F938_9AGAR